MHAADAEVEVLKERLGSLAWPEQFFGANHLTMEHPESGTRLFFGAEDALKAWLAGSETPVHVRTAGKWMQAHAQDVDTHKAKVLQYDWCGAPRREGLICGAWRAATKLFLPRRTPLLHAASHTPLNRPQHTGIGRTFTTGYRGSGVGPAALGASPGNEPVWEATDAQMDRGMLTARDPILMYADVPLFESELEDNGVASLSIKVMTDGRLWLAQRRSHAPSSGTSLRKLSVVLHLKEPPSFPIHLTTHVQIRVMPRCWYALLRFWLRVDGVLIRLRTTRVFCAFKDAPDAVLRKVGR